MTLLHSILNKNRYRQSNAFFPKGHKCLYLFLFFSLQMMILKNIFHTLAYSSSGYQSRTKDVLFNIEHSHITNTVHMLLLIISLWVWSGKRKKGLLEI